MSTEKMTADQAAVESMLASLAAAPVELDRDQLLYRSGIQAAEARARRAQRCWMASTAATSLLAIVLAGVLLARVNSHAAPQPVEFVRAPAAESAPTPSNSASSSSGEPTATDYITTDDRNRRIQIADHPAQYLRMRKLALARAANEWLISSPVPASDPATPPRPISNRALLDELLGT